jgi:hypothetical protein
MENPIEKEAPLSSYGPTSLPENQSPSHSHREVLKFRKISNQEDLQHMHQTEQVSGTGDEADQQFS